MDIGKKDIGNKKEVDTVVSKGEDHYPQLRVKTMM